MMAPLDAGCAALLPPFRCDDRVLVLSGCYKARGLPGAITGYRLAPHVEGGWTYRVKLDNGSVGIDLTIKDLEPEDGWRTVRSA
jgi:hypothetical protein